MSNSSEIKENQSKLHKQYKQLIEDAYNFRQTDSALSDILEYNGLMKYLKHNQEQVKICKSQIKDILPKIEGYV